MCSSIFACASAYAPPVGLAPSELAAIEVFALRERHSKNDSSTLWMKIYDYGNECPSSSPASGDAYLGTLRLSSKQVRESFQVPGDRNVMLQIREKVSSESGGMVTCDLAMWFTPESGVDYTLQFRYVNGVCTASISDSGTTDRVAIQQPGSSCPIPALHHAQTGTPGARP